MSISIITPVLDHPEFIEEYIGATRSVEVIIVDTGSTPESRKAWAACGMLVPYPTPGHNYGHWCNAGYAHSTGDIVVFLNNDVQAAGPWLTDVAASVQPGALYGPELLAQHVDGVEVPFLSGWCLAATRETWERLKELRFSTHVDTIFGTQELHTLQGPWDTHSYPAAGYWEDNDLSFRAMLAGIGLVQTKWSIRHLDGGNGTSKHKKGYYADVARNRATFERAVRAAMAVAR